LLIVFAVVFSASPYVSVNPPDGQYHPLSEIWIDASEPVDWKGLNFINIDNLNVSNIYAGYISVGILYLQTLSSVADNNKVLTIDTNNKVVYIDTSLWDKNDTDDVTDSDLILDANGRIIQISQEGTNRYINADKLDGKDWVDIGLCPSGQVMQGFDSNGNRVCMSVDTNPNDDVTGSGTAGYIAKWTSNNAIGNSVIYESGGNIGIGTTSPGAKLDVVGDIKGNNILPRDSNTYSLGSSSLLWKNIYVYQICLNPDCTARIYWDSANNKLIIEAPSVEVRST